MPWSHVVVRNSAMSRLSSRLRKRDGQGDLSYCPRAKLTTPAFAARQIAGCRMGTDGLRTLAYPSNVCALLWHGATLWWWTCCTNLHRAYINRFTRPIKGRSLPLRKGRNVGKDAEAGILSGSIGAQSHAIGG